MKPRTFLRPLVAAIAATMLGTGCAPDRAVSPSADSPVPAGAADLAYMAPVATQPGTTVPVVQRSEPLDSAVSVTQTIGPAGGTLRIGKAGLLVYFAPGAVSQPTQITATANAGSLVSYSFEPHGIQFAAPVYVFQNLGQTTLADQPDLANTIAGAYTPDGLADINATSSTALVSELHAAYTTTVKVKGRRIQLSDAIFTIQHFSGYILTGGRR